MLKIKDNFIIIIMIFIFLMLLVFCIYLVVDWNVKRKNCHYKTYNQYPCEGATHYARVHRNNNEVCERTKIICEKVD